MAVSQLVFNALAFKSTHILLGPVASFKASNWNINLWAKGGYGLNEPGKYSVQYKEGGLVNNIYINQSGENKNGLAYSIGGGIQYAISNYVGLQLAANYFGTQTDQINYNFDRDKGTSPFYYTAKNNFIQASVGLQFNIGEDKRTRVRSNTDTGINGRMDQKIKTKSNIKNDRIINTSTGNTEELDQKIKTKSN